MTLVTFFFTNGWHFAGLVIVIYAVGESVGHIIANLPRRDTRIATTDGAK